MSERRMSEWRIVRMARWTFRRSAGSDGSGTFPCPPPHQHRRRQMGDTCRKCGGHMKRGKALAQTFVGGMPDFIGETHASTFTAGGPGELVDCRKCEDCGWSVSDG